MAVTIVAIAVIAVAARIVTIYVPPPGYYTIYPPLQSFSLLRK